MRTGPMRPASDRLAAAKQQKGGRGPQISDFRSNNPPFYRVLHGPEIINQALRPSHQCLLKGRHPPIGRPDGTRSEPPSPAQHHRRKEPGSPSPGVPDPNQAPGWSTFLRTPSTHYRDAMPDLDIKSRSLIWTCSPIQTPSHTHPAFSYPISSRAVPSITSSNWTPLLDPLPLTSARHRIKLPTSLSPCLGVPGLPMLRGSPLRCSSFATSV